MNGLAGKKIGVAAVRAAKEISLLIEKQSGTPVILPIQGRQRLNEDISAQNITDFLAESFDWAIFTTGIGARTLTDSAESIGLQSRYIDKLKETKLAVRGSKTMKWIKEYGLEPIHVSADGTMDNLLAALDEEYKGKSPQRIFLQAYDQDDDKLKSILEENGHTVYLSRPYSYEKPDALVVEQLKQSIIEQSLDAIVFTSKTQVRNIFTDPDQSKQLIEAFNDQVLAVAVGKVTAKELESNGIKQVLQPEHQKMGAMIVAIDHHYREQPV
ncbi:uroporphyrinogen-III synthase [uncultured Planococcus sp.]|uniref:uroporphyrinogen-III synthase n=1 Tax=uncultured Planococcus sp. TaxID=337815 RepID=UPI002612E9D0|nr:uroporphyrinogen-III synthase [uncultured Planococcus sp.]